MSLGKFLLDRNRNQRDRIVNSDRFTELSSDQIEIYKKKRATMQQAFAQLVRGREVVYESDMPTNYPRIRALQFEPFYLGEKIVVLSGIDTIKGRHRPVYVQAGLNAGPDFDPVTLADTSHYVLHMYAGLKMPRDECAEDERGSGIHTLSMQTIIYTGVNIEANGGFDSDNKSPTVGSLRAQESFTSSIEEIVATLPK
jgi:hypothetical protein